MRDKHDASDGLQLKLIKKKEKKNTPYGILVTKHALHSKLRIGAGWFIMWRLKGNIYSEVSYRKNPINEPTRHAHLLVSTPVLRIHSNQSSGAVFNCAIACCVYKMVYRGIDDYLCARVSLVVTTTKLIIVVSLTRRSFISHASRSYSYKAADTEAANLSRCASSRVVCCRSFGREAHQLLQCRN